MQPGRVILRHVPSIAIALSVAVPVSAQEHGSVHVSVQAPDSVAHIVDRERPAHAHFALKHFRSLVEVIPQCRREIGNFHALTILHTGFGAKSPLNARAAASFMSRYRKSSATFIRHHL